MKTVAFVPIKMNNERLPGKNTKCFSNGKPLISYILNTLKKVAEIDEIYVYCSSEKICEYLPEGVKFLKRDEYLDLSSTPFNEVLTTFADAVSADIYLLTHATAPFVKKETFSKGINAVKSGEYDSALAVKKLQDFLWKDGKPFNYDTANIPRTQDLEVMFEETSGMYVFREDVVKKYKRRIGNSPYLVEVSNIEACDIDTADDFELADAVSVYADKYLL